MRTGNYQYLYSKGQGLCVRIIDILLELVRTNISRRQEQVNMAHPLYAKNGRFNEYGLNKLLGIEVTRFENGCSHAIIKITESVLGLPPGSAHTGVHGGVIATLVDVGMSAALVSLMKDDEIARTVQLQINYLAAAQSGILACESRVIQKGRKIATVESEVLNEGNIIAKTTGTYYLSKIKEN